MQIQTKWSEEEIKILHSSYGKLTYKQINEFLPNRTIFQIRNKANYDGLCSKNNLRKYSVNKSYFSTPNEQNSYWAGFIAADGNISQDFKKLSIGLQHSDKCILDSFVKDLNYTNETKIYKDRVSVTINCEEICRDLEKNFNITPAKSKTLQPPDNLSDDLCIMAFIKGVIDGDGSVDSKSIVIYGTEHLLSWICNYFDSIIPKSNYRTSKPRKIQDHLWAYKISTNRAKYIAEKFQNLNCFYLARKWDNLYL